MEKHKFHGKQNKIHTETNKNENEPIDGKKENGYTQYNDWMNEEIYKRNILVQIENYEYIAENDWIKRKVFNQTNSKE